MNKAGALMMPLRSEREVAAGSAGPDPTSVRRLTHKKPMRAPLPAHLPRERVVVPAPPCCPCCGGKLVKLGEDVTETLEVVPRQWKVIQTVREKFSCRAYRLSALSCTPIGGATPSHECSGRAMPDHAAND